MHRNKPKVPKQTKRYRRLCRQLAQDFNGAATDQKADIAPAFKAIGFLMERMALYG